MGESIKRIVGPYQDSYSPNGIIGEKDACGVGFIANIKGIKSNWILKQSLKGLNCMEHRGGCGGDSDSGDGAGILCSIPWQYLEEEMNLKIQQNFNTDKKMIKESIASHEFSIICDETFSPSYVELGKIYEYNLDFNKAIYYYEILRSLNSVTSFSLYRLSFCYEKIGAYDESIKNLNEIISKDPLYEKAWISIAKHYLRENNHDKALENLNKALNIIANNY